MGFLKELFDKYVTFVFEKLLFISCFSWCINMNHGQLSGIMMCKNRVPTKYPEGVTSGLLVSGLTRPAIYQYCLKYAVLKV